MLKNAALSKFLKRFFAVTLCAVMVFSYVPLKMEVGAKSDCVSYDPFHIPNTDDFIDVSSTWDTYNPMVENIFENGEGAGVRITFCGGDVGRNVPTSKKYNTDGLTLRFGSISKRGDAAGALRFTVMASETAGLGLFRVMFDTDAGTLSYFNASVSPVVFAQSEYLKYNSLTTGFTVGFASDTNGNMICTVETNGATVSGAIPASFAKDIPKNSNSAYISIAPGKADANSFYSFSAEVTGIKHDEFTRPTSATLKEQNQNGKSTVVSKPNGAFPQKVLCTFNGCDIGNRLPSAAKYSIDGLTLRFDELQKLSGYEQNDLKFAVTFPDDQGSIGTARIMFDTAAGTVSYYNASVSPVEILQNDLLKYENLSAEEFTLRFIINDDGDCICLIEVSSVVLRAVVPAAYFAENAVSVSYFAVAPGNSTCYFSVCLTGVYSATTEENYYLPDVYDFSVSDGWSENIPEIEGAYSSWQKSGVKLTFNGGDVSRRISSTAKYNADGMKLLFSSLVKNTLSQGETCFSILFSEDNGLGTFRLLFDTGAGTVSYFNAKTSPTVFITDESLKYGTLSQNDFSVGLMSNSDGSLACRICVGGAQAISGNVPAAFCGNLAKNTEAVYLQIAPGVQTTGNSYYFSLSLKWIICDSYTRPVSSTLNQVAYGKATDTSVPNGAFPKKVVCAVDTYGLISYERYSSDGLSLRFAELYEPLALKLVGENADVGVVLDPVRGALSMLQADGTTYDIASDPLLKTDASEGGNVTLSFIKKGYALYCRVERGESYGNKYIEALVAENTVELGDTVRFKLFSIEQNVSFELTGVHEMARYIDNSSLIPQYMPDHFVSVDANGTPEWASSLIIAEVNVENFGTFKDMIPVLEHCAETGINALWLTPIADKGTDGNGYSNLGINTVDPFLSGVISEGESWRQTDYSVGWEVFRQFVEQAHKRNVRIFLDIVSWGTLEASPIYTEHPEWYSGDSIWGGKDYDWNNTELKTWFIDTLVQMAADTGIDGFRYDLEPAEAGYEVNAQIKSKLLDAGRKLVYFSESSNERQSAYDFSQSDVIGRKYVSTQYFEAAFEDTDMTDAVKSGSSIGSLEKQDSFESGTYRFYSHTLSCHDSYAYGAAGDKLVMGYQALFAPFIPIWAIGEEFNNGKDGNVSILYKNTLKLEALNDPQKRDYFESVKQMISIRRRYSELFEYFPDNHRNSNICRIDIQGQELSGYARYKDDYGVLVIPNTGSAAALNIEVSFAGMGMCGYDSYTLTDLYTGKMIASGTEQSLASLEIQIAAGDIGAFLITADGIGNGDMPVYTPKNGENTTVYETVGSSKISYKLSHEDFNDSPDADCVSVFRNGKLCGVKISNGTARLTEQYNADGFVIKASALEADSLSVIFSQPQNSGELQISVSPSGIMQYKYGSLAVQIASGDLSAISSENFKLSFEINSNGALSCILELENGTEITGTVPADITKAYIGANTASSVIKLCVSGGAAEIAGIGYDAYTVPDGSLLVRMQNGSTDSLTASYKGGYPNGVVSTFNGININGRQVTASAYTVDGFTVRFSELEKLQGHEENFLRFCMGFCETTDSLPRMRLVFDADLGTLEYYSGVYPYGEFTEICRNELLKYENLQGRKFSVAFDLIEGDALAVEVNVGGNKVNAVIPSEFYRSYISSEEAKFFIAPANRNGYFSVKLDGIAHTAAVNMINDGTTDTVRIPVNNYIRLPDAAAPESSVMLGWYDEENIFYDIDSKISVTSDMCFTAENVLIGDANTDDIIDGLDLVLLRQTLLGRINTVSSRIIDLTADGEVDIRDMVRLKKLLIASE